MNSNRRHLRGSAITVSAVLSGVIGLALVGYLRLVNVQQNMLHRAQHWNFALPVAEAGIEDALAHLHCFAHGSNLTGNGWSQDLSSGNVYTKSNLIGNDTYEVSLKATGPYSPVTVTSIGYCRLLPSNQLIQRKVQVQASRYSMFSKGMVADGQIDLLGNNVMTDSFDSEDPTYSTNGKYDPAKSKANGDVGTNSGLIDSINTGNANIHGYAATGPGGTVAIGPNGAIGDHDWNTFHTGIQSGHVTDDMNINLPDIDLPYTGGPAPTSGTVDGINYTYLLKSGNYFLSSLSMNGQQTMIVTNQATLVINGSFSMGGQSQIILTNGGSLKLYVNGSASIGGNGVANYSGKATNFFFFGTTNCTSLSYGGNGEFTGAVYAPNADFTLGGGGSGILDFVGASVSKTVRMNGHYNGSSFFRA